MRILHSCILPVNQSDFFPALFLHKKEIVRHCINMGQNLFSSMCINQRNLQQFLLIQFLIYSLHDNKPVYRLLRQSIRRLAFVPPYSVFCSISFRCGGLSIERNQKPLAPEITLALTHHDRQKQFEVKRSSRVNPHEIRIFSGCPYYISSPGTCNSNLIIFHNKLLLQFSLRISSKFSLCLCSHPERRYREFLLPTPQ